MLRSLTSRLILTALFTSFTLPAMIIAQSQSGESVAEAARRAREQKKAAAKPVKIVTEDDIPARIPSSDAQPAAAPSDNPATPPNDGSAAAPSGKETPALKGKPAGSKAEKDAEIAALKETISKAQQEVDVLTRGLALGQDSFFSNPDYAHDTAGKAKLDNIKQQIDNKQGDLSQLKSQLADLLAGGPAAPDTAQPPPAAPAPQS